MVSITDSAFWWRAIGRLASLPSLTIILIAVTGILEPRFFGAGNISNIVRNASFLTIASAGQMLVLIAGGFDLSVAAVVALTSVMSAMAMASAYVMFPDAPLLVIAIGVFAGLAVGFVVGAFNGLAVTLLGASPFIVTLGALSIASGVAYYLTAGIPIYGLPDHFTKSFGRASWLGIPAPVYFAVAIALALWLIQNRTAVGRHWYAIGGNVKAAQLSGIAVRSNTIGMYVLASVLVSIVGILLTARIGSGQATLGSDLTIQSIAAAVLAGVSLRGGVGRIEMVVLGSLFLAILSNSMNLLRFDSKIQTVVIGLFLVAAVLVDRLSAKARKDE